MIVVCGALSRKNTWGRSINLATKYHVWRQWRRKRKMLHPNWQFSMATDAKFPTRWFYAPFNSNGLCPFRRRNGQYFIVHKTPISIKHFLHPNKGTKNIFAMVETFYTHTHTFYRLALSYGMAGGTEKRLKCFLSFITWRNWDKLLRK